ncbi:response regulator transcription factor [Salmonella enterica subsp. enterica serovar Typhisuis str. CFSAN000654]|uniref:Response regulator transcription factor n=3 Tax=Salmonella enterica TaxID=28901 RepID=A0A701AYC8_SALTM|nr:LuxR C-terminal-related transcriptional regulator [Salmonella enterica]ECK9482757.1 response regulator transcription factor [Salmonella enterica subsp. enterica serovar Typhisuis str. CFSAN000654]QVP85632.1 response regulator transcription factor [Salmonella enterica subsp. enterica serovar Typhimurium str. CFSAN000648]HAE1779890.1 response regulator transcription factor [Salmonella enterica subsp. enterica serovar Typhisuis]HDJ1972068.1 response regulator transcription factor [Salmonella en
MLKILVIDRCHFTRTGMEAWLNHTDVLSSSLLVSGMNNLILAKEHILQWKPHLVIADLYGFLNDALPEQPINAFFAASRMTPLVLLQSGNMPYRPQYASHAVLSKHTPLHELAQRIKGALHTHPLQEAPESATPLLSPQEEKVLAMWTEGTSNKEIAYALGIHGKTVYTYKRNIRMKLHMDNRYSPFLMLPEKID